MDKEFWTNKGLEVVRILVGNIWNRTGAVIAVAGVGVLTGWIDKFVMAYTQLRWEEPAQWVGWTFLVIGLAMLIYGGWKARPPNAHDIQLIGDFRKLFGRADIDFLKNHNFAQNWHVTQTSSMEDISDDWIGARYEFVDRKLNKRLAVVKRLSAELANAEQYGFSIGPNLQVRTMRNNADRNGLTKETQAKVDNLNRIARELAEAIDDLERIAKVRLPAA
ncbi:MAG: hypothetical protein IJ935_21785 [Afipia sp.]|nr:hypothetical protein [Afipia sp.]